MHRAALAFLIVTAAFAQDPPYTTWRDYAGSADSAQYSALKQINRANVSQLQVGLDVPDRRRPQVLFQSRWWLTT